jgi:ribonucleoside-triphosphate reductase
LQDLLEQGFGGVLAKVESRPPRHLRTALGQLVNFFYTLQGESAGAVAVSNFDTLLAPFVRYDHLSYRQVKQAVQEFVFNINVPTRVGFQTPFTNVTMDLTPPSTLANEPVVVGGETQDAVYGDFQAEMNLINRAFAEVMLEGDAHGRVFTFPIPTYNLTPDFDWENPELEPIWAMTARYGIPYFANFVNSDMKVEDARSMCCRLRLDNRELRKRGGGLFAAAPLTGSVGVVTVNLARLGHTARNERDFHDRLERLMEVSKTSLEIKRKMLEALTERGLYPYSHHYLRNIKESTGHFWSNHFSTIGINGMNEACLNFLGVGIEHPDGKAFASRTLRFMLDVLVRFQEETGNLYNLEATPAEGATYRLARADQERFPEIVTAGTEEAPYYTNSTHLPVDFSDDVFEVLDHQDDLQTLYTGGTVLHIFLGEQIDDWRQARTLVRAVAENYRLPYYTLTPTFSICPVHGYIAGEHEYCPYEHTEEDLARYGRSASVAEREQRVPVSRSTPCPQVEAEKAQRVRAPGE